MTHASPANEPTPTPRIPNLIAIASGKGGVGKTWASATLSQALSFNGQRVLLIDGDLGLANVDVQLGLEPQCDVADAISGRKTFADCVTPAAGGAGQRGGFDVLAGRSGSALLSNLNPEEWRRLTRGVAALSGFYDAALVDLGAGVESSVIGFAMASAVVYVVLTDEPTSLTDAYALIKRLAQNGRTSGIEILVNMAQDHAEGRRTAATLARSAQGFLNMELPLAGVLRRDPKVREAIRRQQPFLSRFPQSPAAVDMTMLAEHVARKVLAPMPDRHAKLAANLR